MAGANLSFGNGKRILAKVMGLLDTKRQGRVGSVSKGNMCIKAGVPADDTAADDPEQDGVFCYDSTNEDVYISRDYVSSTDHTWTKITAT